jgi:hypothetical protein
MVDGISVGSSLCASATAAEASTGVIRPVAGHANRPRWPRFTAAAAPYTLSSRAQLLAPVVAAAESQGLGI